MPIAAGGESSTGGPSVPVKGARVALVLLLLINLFNYIDRYVLAAVEKVVSGDLLPGDPNALTKMGWLANAFLVSYMVLSPLFGRLAIKWSRWALVGFGVGLWSLASGATGLAHAYVALLLTRCLVGVGEAAYGPIAPTLIADMYPVRVRGQILAWFYAAIPVGGAMGYAIGGGVASAWGWRTAFYVVVPPGLLLAAWAFFMKEPKKEVRAEASRSPATKRSIWEDIGELVRIKSYVLDTIGMLFMTFAIGGISFFMPRYMIDAGAGDAGRVGLIFGGISAGAGLFATLSGGWLGDKLRGRVPGSYFLVSAIGLGVGFPLFLGVLFVPSIGGKWVLLAMAVFALFFNTGPSNTILANVTPGRLRSTAFALNILVIHALGDAISPVVIGFVADRSSLRMGFVVASVTFLLGAVFWMLGVPHLKGDTERAEAASGVVTA